MSGSIAPQSQRSLLIVPLGWELYRSKKKISFKHYFYFFSKLKFPFNPPVSIFGEPRYLKGRSIQYVVYEVVGSWLKQKISATQSFPFSRRSYYLFLLILRFFPIITFRVFKFFCQYFISTHCIIHYLIIFIIICYSNSFYLHNTNQITLVH